MSIQGLKPVFVHGWACGPEIWAPLQQQLGWDGVCRVDLGYFEPSPQNGSVNPAEFLQNADDQPILATGHSLGLLWLLSQRDWPEGSRFVGINAFGRFSATEGFAAGVSPRVLSRMRAGLTRNAYDVAENFRARCGLPVPEGISCNADVLDEGLALLAEGDVREKMQYIACKRNLLLLAGGDDPIVSPAMTRNAVPAEAEIVWQSDGGHMLPVTHVSFCADHIKNFISKAV